MTMTPQGPAAFASNTADTPAVNATGTNGAVGVDASSDSSFGVRGRSSNSVGVGGQSNRYIGVGGESNSGDGVAGLSESGPGVVGQSTSDTGVFSLSESGDGVYGQSFSGTGVVGKSFAGTGIGVGVYGQSFSDTGVAGESESGSGVAGLSNSSTGVVGISNSGVGVLGMSGSGLAGQFNGNVEVFGNLSVTGIKPFVQAHPTDPHREIVYIAQEGGEAGTYVRGSGQLRNGKAELALPEHFALVTEPSGLTVQLTPRGEWLQLYLEELDTARLVVREAQGKSGAFDYLIQGVRRGFEQHEVIRTKR